MSKVKATAIFCPPGLTRAEQRLIIRYRLATREHLLRRTDGGRQTPDNIVLACNECNTKRGATSPDVWQIIRRLTVLYESHL